MVTQLIRGQLSNRMNGSVLEYSHSDTGLDYVHSIGIRQLYRRMMDSGSNSRLMLARMLCTPFISTRTKRNSWYSFCPQSRSML